MATTAQAPDRKSVVKKMAAKKQQQYTFRLNHHWFTSFKNREQYKSGMLMLANIDDILWPYYVNEENKLVPSGIDEDITGKEAEYYPRQIRYLANGSIKSIFVDEQEDLPSFKNEKTKEQFLNFDQNRDHLVFHNGELTVDASNAKLKNFLHFRNQCENQYAKCNDNGTRAKMIKTEYKLIDFAAIDNAVIDLGAKKEDAYQLAKTARYEEMYPHAKFLNISFVQEGSMETKSVERIKQDYIDYALSNPVKFLDTFNDPRIKVIYKIRNLVDSNEICLTKVYGQAHWTKTEAFIVQIPQDQDPVTFLAEYALTKNGEEFSNNLRAFKTL